MPLTRTNKDGTTTSISVSPTNVVIALTIAGAAYAAYRFLAGEPRHKVLAYPKLKSIVKYGYFNPSTHKWEIRERELPIEEHGNEAKAAMTGLTQEYKMKDLYYIFKKFYTYNDLRLLHNFWHANIDASKSLYDWIYAEMPSSPEEVGEQQEVLAKLTNAGVGNNLIMKLSPPLLLIK